MLWVWRCRHFFFQAEDGIRDFCLSRGLGDVYKRQLKHRYLHTAPERDILSSPYDELALLKKRISFSDLAASTQDIICAENPAFERNSFGMWDFFIWGSLADLEALLQKPVKNEDDKCISKTLLKELVFKIQDQISFFQQTIPHWINNWSPETSVRIIICEL